MADGVGRVDAAPGTSGAADGADQGKVTWTAAVDQARAKPAHEHHWYDRPLGVLQAVGGVGEIALGGGLLAAPEPTMLTKVAGAAVGLHGIDDVQAGLRTAWTGEPTETVTQQVVTEGAKGLGASPGTAAMAGIVADTGLGMANPEGDANKIVHGASELSDAEKAAKLGEGTARLGKLTGSLEHLEPAEKEFVQELLRQGRDVEVVPTGAGRTPDFKIDGVPTELKTLSGVAKQTSDGLSSALSSRIMDARGQSGNVIVDARQQPGMTREIAERGINRAFGNDNRSGARLRHVTVLTNEGTAVRVREP